MQNHITSFKPFPSKKRIGRYWKTILSIIPDSVTIYDPDGDVVYANELASHDLRYTTLEQLMKQNISDITNRFIFRDENGRFIKSADLPTKRAMREGKVAEETIHFTAIDGSDEFWLVAKAFPILDSHKEIKFIVSTYYEITSFKQAEVKLQESNRRMLTILDDLMNLESDR